MKTTGKLTWCLALLSVLGLLTGCLPGDGTITASQPQVPSPEVRLDTGHQAPATRDRRDIEAGSTVVSLTFDDGNASQYAAVQVLDELGLRGTFYVNSSVLETEGYYTREQLDTMVTNGHEIAGHGLQHRNLTNLDEREVQRQICWDRQNMLDWGYQVTSFAYPEAASTERIQEIAEECGYNSARGLGAVASVTGCENCPTAEDFTPPNPFNTRAPAMVESDWTLQDMQDLVTAAENDGGGWVQLTFHHVCPEVCNDISVEVDTFERFAKWLRDREAATGTVVRTVDEVIGGQVQPAVAPVLEPAGTEGNLVVNPSMDEPSDSSPARCWQMAGYGQNSVAGSLAPQGLNGSPALRLEISEFTDGDAKFLQRLDTGECAPQVQAGQRYELGADYQADNDTQFVVYLRDQMGEWAYWTASGWFEPSDQAARAQWITPEIPKGFTGMSFGLSLFDQGTLLVDDVQMSVYTD